ncbi:MAG: thioredoxin domain-containing protein [Thiohalomonadales bacterium]
MSKYERLQRKPNRLVDETSPYLLQHAHNPVRWYPWGEEALQEAKLTDKPILLSIGYSACHWCHVMAHESFEDDDTADVMNQFYINVKVDREERPDLDKIYQFAHQVLVRRGGGWPLTCILTPQNQLPFFAGTYFPDQARHNMPSFKDVLRQVAQFYREKSDEIERQNASFENLLQQIEAQGQKNSQADLNLVPLDQSRQQLQTSYDALFGGFGAAPKFPHPTNLERLMRHWWNTEQTTNADNDALDMALTTLKSMAQGGIYDQLGGGFYRYSVDQEWMIPHFEKMLYDNGPLMCLYINAWRISGEKLFQQVAIETGDWALREMQADEGGFYSSLDADSEGQEGKFYAWQPEQIKSILSIEQYELFAVRFGLDRPSNFEGDWHLHVAEAMEEIAKAHNLPLSAATEMINDSRQQLFRERESRIRPGRDEKILTAWNALLIKGLALTGRIAQRVEFVTAAGEALDFIERQLFVDNRLRVSYKDGQARLNAYLDDHAFLLDAILELLQARWRQHDLEFAVKLADILLEQFQDCVGGGFYFTSKDHEKLIQRSKPFADEAIPSGNGIAAYGLLRLGYLLGEVKYIEAAEGTLRAAWRDIIDAPAQHNALLLALEELSMPTEIIVIRAEAAQLEQWQAIAQRVYAPRRLLIAIPNDATGLAEGLAQYKSSTGPIAYICKGQQCEKPIEDIKQFAEYL